MATNSTKATSLSFDDFHRIFSQPWFYTAHYAPTRLLEQDNIQIISLSFAFHVISFFLCLFLSGYFFQTFNKLSLRNKCNWSSRVICNIHAIISFILAFYTILNDKIYFWELDMRHYDFFIGQFTLQYSFGYFIYETILVLIFWKDQGGLPMFLHHCIAITGWGLLLAYRSFAFIVLVFTLTELSTPFISQRWFLEISEMKNTKLYIYNGIAIWISWTLCRVSLIFIMPYIIYYNFEHYKTIPLIITVLLFCFNLLISGLNAMWYLKICKGVFKVLVGSNNRTQSESKKEK
ncbi:hypothetical protein ABK040_004999 [Willaertia magna]